MKEFTNPVKLTELTPFQKAQLAPEVPHDSQKNTSDNDPLDEHLLYLIEIQRRSSNISMLPSCFNPERSASPLGSRQLKKDQACCIIL